MPGKLAWALEFREVITLLGLGVRGAQEREAQPVGHCESRPLLLVTLTHVASSVDH